MKTKKRRFLGFLLSLTLTLSLIPAFSLTALADYTVEFTRGDLQYVMPGDSEVTLSEILETVGLIGEVEAVEVSNAELFSASKEDGAWVICANQPFDTVEWLRVTISGVVYEITVTDMQIFVVYVEDSNNHTITLEVEASDIISAIKERIKNATQIPVDRQTLSFGSYNNLEDNCTLADYNIQKESTLTLTIAYNVTITSGSNMTKTTDSGAASQTGITGAMTDVVYTANDGYYFPTDYSVDAVNGISVIRDSYTQITVTGTPAADAEISVTEPTAKTQPDAPATAAAVNCATADNNDGKLTGVTTDMEYKMSDADDWTDGTGSDITGLVPGTYYVRYKATDTTLASENQELMIAEYVVLSYSVTISGGANAAPDPAAEVSQTVPPGEAMTTVTFTAGDGYQFPPASGYYTTTNGITVARASVNTVIVSGTPTADAAVTIPNAVKFVEYINYEYNNNGITSSSVNACEAYTVVSSGTTTWQTGWYVVNSSVTINSRVNVSGNVHLILCDGCTLNAVKGIHVATNNSLTIYAQSEDSTTMGVLNSRTSDDKSGNAGIGGNSREAAGTIVFNGGKITAQGSTNSSGAGGGAAFGTGQNPSNDNVKKMKIVVNGGILNKSAMKSVAAIGGGQTSGGGTVLINGGTLNLQTYAGSVIGNGWDGKNNYTDITINGGTLNLTSWTSGYCIGADKANVRITGGTITAFTSGANRAISGTLTLADNMVVRAGDVNDFSQSLPCLDQTTNRTKYVKIWEHIHSDFTYVIDGNVFSAHCSNDNCNLNNGNMSLTLTAEDMTYNSQAYDRASVKWDGFKHSFASEYQLLTGNTVSVGDIEYYQGETKVNPAKNAGQYTAKVTVTTGGNGYTIEDDFEIFAADPTANAPAGLTAVYGQTLADVSLENKNPDGNTPGTWAWADISTGVGALGDHTFPANFTPTDTHNYNTKNNVDVTVTVEKELPSFKTYSVTLGAELGLNFYINLPEIEGVLSYDDCYVAFSVQGKEIDRKAFDENISRNGKGYYKFTANLNVTQMAEEVTAVLHYRDNGEEKILSDKRSIKDYVVAFENAREQYPDNQALAKAEEMVYSMADYGHYTQVYLAKAKHWTYGETYAAMDKFFSNPYETEQINEAVNAIKNGYGLKNKSLTDDIAKDPSMTLTLDSRTAFNLYITPAEGYTGTVSAKVGGINVRVRKMNDGRYRISALDIAATQLGTDLNFVITTEKGDSIFTASALYYVYMALSGDNSDDEMRDAMVSIYRYYKAAVDYVEGQ